MKENLLKSADLRKLPDGRHADGKYLYLNVSGESRSWVVRGPTALGRPERGLGSADFVSLATARRKRDEVLALWQDGRDPREEKRKAAEAAAKRKTFGQVAEEVIKNRVGSWAISELNKKSSTLAQWRRDMAIVCKPIAARSIDEIALDDIKPIVMPYFDAKHDERAKGLLNRLESVFDYAFAHGWRTAGNPATSKIWKELAPKRPKKEEEEAHHAAIPWREVPAVVSRVRSSGAVAARLTEFIILTATRSQEARGAQWSEIDFDRQVWTIPASRMKMRRDHEVPLSEPAIALLRRMPRDGALVFVGGVGSVAQAKSKPISHQGLWAFVQRASGQDEATVHGFRSAFKDWADNNGVDDKLSEKCLAHKEKDKVKRAYARDQLTEPRRSIMEAWARFVDGDTNDNVVPFRRIA